MPTAKKRTARKLDPSKRFVIQTVSREDIADMLNEAIEASGTSSVAEFADDDARLTDEVCQDIANSLYDASEVDDAVEQDVYASALEQFEAD